jgi:selenide,water dikinase
MGALPRRRLAAALRARGAEVIEAHAAEVRADGVTLDDGRRLAAELVVWATGAAAHPWLRETGLTLDEKGFIVVDAALRSVDDPAVFAAGDTAAVAPHPREKAGVYAVRQGPPLAENLRRALAGEAPQPFDPQRRALQLIGEGDRTAIGIMGPLALRGRAMWRLKDWIDRRWMAAYRDLPPRR